MALHHFLGCICACILPSCTCPTPWSVHFRRVPCVVPPACSLTRRLEGHDGGTQGPVVVFQPSPLLDTLTQPQQR